MGDIATELRVRTVRRFLFGRPRKLDLHAHAPRLTGSRAVCGEWREFGRVFHVNETTANRDLFRTSA